jgi:hypothetical protein
MTMKDLQRIVLSDEANIASKEMQDLQRRLRDRPFYIWGSEKHWAASNPNNEIKGHCCFNHIIGLPQKNGVPQPLWNYQEMIYRALMFPGYLNSIPGQEQGLHNFKLKHVWIKKATGLGINRIYVKVHSAF